MITFPRTVTVPDAAGVVETTVVASPFASVSFEVTSTSTGVSVAVVTTSSTATGAALATRTVTVAVATSVPSETV